MIGTICNISENNAINYKSDITICNKESSGELFSIQQIDENIILISYKVPATNSIYVTICKLIDDKLNLIIDNEIEISQNVKNSLSSIYLSNTIFTVYDNYNTNYIYGLINKIDKVIHKNVKSGIINGIAKTNGIAEEIVQVYVPNYNEEEE